MEQHVEQTARSLLNAAGVREQPVFSPMGKGGNNKLYRVECGAERFVLKVYFQHPDDPRNRLHSEFSFTSFVWDHGVRCVPRPIARHDSPPVGLYGFLEGEEPRPEQVDRRLVSEAWEFFIAINQHRGAQRAQGLPPASEACFTLGAHLSLVDRRMSRLCRIDPGRSGLAAMAAEFVGERLLPAWDEIRGNALDLAGQGTSQSTELHPRDRFLCPADLGFHNAILAPDGTTKFVDFEYAGWDDPVKFFCDFFLHPALPCPHELVPEFAERIAAIMQDSRRFRVWTRALFGVHALKWCCIMLNDFLPGDEARRRFARGPENIEDRKERQLQKAQRAFAQISKMGW